MEWLDKSPFERDRDRATWQRWSDIEAVAQKVRQSHPDAVKRAIDYLVEDPRYHGSGYTKELLWRRLAAADVSQKERHRLEGAAIGYLHRRINREFWVMARYMAQLASRAFWDAIRDYVESGEGIIRRRATLLNAYEGGVSAGEKVKRQFRYRRTS